MADRFKSDRTVRLEVVCWVAFLAAVAPNTIDAFTSPSGGWWEALRFSLSTFFAVAILALLASRFANRRRR
jgi:hypothetical protein